MVKNKKKSKTKNKTKTLSKKPSKKKRFVLWFKELTIKDVPLVGGKNASLGEMCSSLSRKGVQVPDGFAVTAYAYRYLLKKSGIESKIKEALKDLDTHDLRSLAAKGKQIRALIRNAEFPEELREEIVNAYRKLCKKYGANTDVAVRSSATAEDLPDASFAGQQETYLNVKGEDAVIEACKRCFASLFTNRAISYREDKGFDHFSVALSIGIQKMVRSDLACSGVMFTIDTESGFDKVVFVTASYGLGENIVQGAVNPDEYYVFKPTLKKGYRAIISKKIGSKQIKMVYSNNPKKPTKNIPTTASERKRFALSDDEVLQLAKWGCIIEEHYTKKHGRYTPMDIEWAKDGKLNQLFIVQARPETVHSQKDVATLEEYVLQGKSEVLAVGRSVGDKIGAGKANVIMSPNQISKFNKGDVLVTDMTDPDWEPIMKIASAIVTNRGGRTCHAAIVSRELGIPCIVGTGNATEKVKTGMGITVDCAAGEEGKVYKGVLKYKVVRHDLKKMPKTRTAIMMNVGNPETAFAYSFIPNQGVGLAREEFIINSYIKIHPNALIYFNKIKNERVKKKIEAMTQGYANKVDFFIEQLAHGIGMIGAAFYPHDVIVRLSDFKTNEYANLIGGKEWEPHEENPMIGWRGASRYYRENFREAFGLECKALKKVRDEMGLTNVKVMVPFCRTVEEGKKVIAEMKKHGLVQGENGLEVYVMCEIPSNVVLADQFAEVFDGFSIGSNDLTQLTLGLDRDSALVADIYDERNPAVLRLIESVIRVARKKKRKIGICGQAPSDFPEFAEFLVRCGINSISLNPDTVLKTTLRIAQTEKKLGIKAK